ncbi:MAG: NAD(P)/FAD-dependent oxidoreductase [Oscillospiraceae bacterium]|nr:NAD(P)/FAD-dependent oxidoreductase [Oscillospiraceae bacterium]
MRRSTTDVLVIGGGAAGMLSAITAARRGLRVLLLEKNDRLGKKLAITGKGRCNVTNDSPPEEIMKNIPRNGRFLYSSIYGFTAQDAMAFFEESGCPLKVERGNRVFPVSDRSADVIQALRSAMQRAGVQQRQETVRSILVQDGAVSGVKTERGPITCGCVLLCTGGVSYPLTGSTGDGYAMARALGHTVVEPRPSLAPMESQDPACAEMQGLSLRNTALRLVDAKGKAVYKDFGELLFTHFGVSGPMALSASAHMKEGTAYRIELDLKPALEEAKLDARLLRDLEQYQNRSMENALADLFPHSLIPVMLERCGIDPALQANSLTRQQRRALVEQTKCFTIPISGLRPVEEAIITRGGVSVREIDPKTMESKLVPGLYFAGEIIDCDAYTGGFNLQIAWSTGFAAGSHCLEEKN